MKLIQKFAILGICLLSAACGSSEQDLYHYKPTRADEVPATLTNTIVESDIWNGRVTEPVEVIINKINGKNIEFRYTGPLHGYDPVATYQLSPGITTLHIVGSIGNGPLAVTLQEADLILDVLPGEKYLVTKCGEIALCIEDSHGKTIVRKAYTISLHH